MENNNEKLPVVDRSIQNGWGLIILVEVEKSLLELGLWEISFSVIWHLLVLTALTIAVDEFNLVVTEFSEVLSRVHSHAQRHIRINSLVLRCFVYSALWLTGQVPSIMKSARCRMGSKTLVSCERAYRVVDNLVSLVFYMKFATGLNHVNKLAAALGWWIVWSKLKGDWLSTIEWEKLVDNLDLKMWEFHISMKAPTALLLLLQVTLER